MMTLASFIGILDIILILVLQKENSVFGHALVKGM